MSSMRQWACSSCSNTVHEGQKFCANCGEKIHVTVTSKVTCSGTLDGSLCLNILTTNVKFCPKCGTKNEAEVICSDDSEDDDVEDEKCDVKLTKSKVNEQTVYADLLTKLKNEGPQEIKRVIKEKLSSWEKEVVKFGTIGRSAMGKSTFINMMLDLKPSDPNYAQTGSGDTTMEVKVYQHPKNNNLSLWDMPGFGTAEMTKARFLDKVDLSLFDYFFIFIDTVFMEDDIWLAKKLKELGVPFCFIRTKLDLHIKQAVEKGQTQNEAVDHLRKKLVKTMMKHDVLRESKLFLISNIRSYYHVGDLSLLIADISKLLPDCKVEVLMFFLPVLAPNVIDMKYKQMKKRIRYVSFLAGVLSAVPVPLIEVPVNLAIMTKEVKRYIKVFCLKDESVKSVPGLKHRSIGNKSLIDFTKEAFKELLKTGVKIGGIVALSQVDFVMPVVGSAITGLSTVFIVSSFLRSNLKELRNDAKTVYNHFTVSQN